MLPPRGVWPAVVLSVVAHGSWLLLDLRFGGLAEVWPATLAVAALGFVALAWAVKASRIEAPRPLSILIVALVLRALLLPLEPTLSNDALRYLWDGRVLAAGFDPYQLPPEAAQLEPLRDGLWDGLHHRDVPTVYPPLAMALFTAAAKVPLDWPIQLVALKVMLVLADLLSCCGLVYIARRRALSTAVVLAYAWNPLVTLEVAGMGHVDALGVACVVLGVVLWTRSSSHAYGSRENLDRLPSLCAPSTKEPLGWRPTVGLAAAAAAGILSKLVPVVLLPLWGATTRRPWLLWSAAAGFLAVAFAPLLWSIGGVPPGLVRYGVSWEFNGPVYEPLWRGLEAVGTPAWVEAALNWVKAADGHNPFWNGFYPYNYPQLHAKLLLALALCVTVLAFAWSAWRGVRRDLVTTTGALLGAALLCTATFYPWYALWVLPWAALCRHRAWLALSALLFLTYAPQHGGFDHWPWTFLLVWVPFAALLWRQPRWSFP